MEKLSEKITDINEIRAMVEKRRAEEEKTRGGGGGGDSDLPSHFVRACLRTNQLGDGELYKALHRNKFLFCKNLQTWLKWTGHHWKEDTMDAALAAVEDIADAYEKEAATIRSEMGDTQDKHIRKGLERMVDALESRANQLRGDNRRQACLKFAHTTKDPLAIEGGELDRNPMLLGCRNGVVELATGRFRDGRPDDYILKASPHEWKGIDHPCPTWEKAMLDIQGGDEQMVLFWQRLLGMALCGKVVEKIFPVLIGPGGDNGKTTMIEAVSYAIGPLGGPVAPEMLVASFNSSGSGLDPDMMALKGLRFAYASETEDNARVSCAKVKKLTGKDSLEARSPYDRRKTTWEPTHTLFLLSNFKLRADSEDKAFWTRTIYIPFDIRFVKGEPKGPNERKADPYIDDKLAKEAPGILAWLVRGFLAWQADGLQIPPRVIKESKRSRDDQDYFGAFLDECCFTKDDDASGLGSSQIYAVFEKWYRKNIGNFVPKIRTFGIYMKAHYEHRKVNGFMRYFGLELNYDVVRVYDPDASRADWVSF